MEFWHRVQIAPPIDRCLHLCLLLPQQAQRDQIMGSHQVLWDLYGQVKVRQRDPRSPATSGVAATNALPAFRTSFLNNPVVLMARIVRHKVPVSAVEVGVQTTSAIFRHQLRPGLQPHCYHDKTNLSDKTLSHPLALIFSPTAPPVVLPPLTMERTILVGVIVAGEKVPTEVPTEVPRGAQRGDPPDTGRVALIATIAVLLEAISRLQVPRPLGAIVTGHLEEAKSRRVSIEVGVEWVLGQAPGHLRLIWVGEKRVVVAETAIWVPRSGVGEARATGGKWKTGARGGGEEMARGVIEAMRGNGARVGGSEGEAEKIPGWGLVTGRGVGGGCSRCRGDRVDGDDLGRIRPVLAVLHERLGKGMESFSCVLLRGDPDVRGARGSADFSLFSSAVASEGSCGGNSQKMRTWLRGSLRGLGYVASSLRSG